MNINENAVAVTTTARKSALGFFRTPDIQLTLTMFRSMFMGTGLERPSIIAMKVRL